MYSKEWLLYSINSTVNISISCNCGKTYANFLYTKVNPIHSFTECEHQSQDGQRMLRIRRGRGILIVINCIFFGVLDISFKTTRTTEDSKFERQAKTTRGAALSQRAICLHLKPVLLLPPGILAAKSVFRKRNLFFSLTPSM